MRLLFITLFSVLFAGTASGVLAQPFASPAFHAIAERLDYMPDVALHKALHAQPVEDLPREAVVLENAAKTARAAGLDPQSALPFYRAQIAAAKAIQYRHLADWLSQPDALKQSALDLDLIIRPALLKLDIEIAHRIAEHLRSAGPFSDTERPLFDTQLQTPHLTARDRTQLFEALKQIRLLQE